MFKLLCTKKCNIYRLLELKFEAKILLFGIRIANVLASINVERRVNYYTIGYNKTLVLMCQLLDI